METIFTFTVKPTYRSCDYNFSQSVNIVFGNGCNADSGVCGEIKTFVQSVVENINTHNSDEMDSCKVYSHNKNDNTNVIGDGMNRDELISSMDNIECGSKPQNTDFDSANINAMINLRDNGSDSNDRRLLNLSFCDDTCDNDDQQSIAVFSLQQHSLKGTPIYSRVYCKWNPKIQQQIFLSMINDEYQDDTRLQANWWMCHICNNIEYWNKQSHISLNVFSIQ